MPLSRGGRPLKRWRYVGVFTERVMACAASVQIGPAHQTFWAVLDRQSKAMREKTRLIPRPLALDLTPGRFGIYDEALMLELELEETAAIEARCPHGRQYVWTRKQAGVQAHGTLVLGADPPIPVEGLAVIDDTAGYHSRTTEWRWAAGVGVGPEGSSLAFNLVEGVNDPPTGSERAIWIDGIPHEVPPVRFSEDLSTVASVDGSSELRFRAEAERSRRENLLLVRSDYRAPFGSFSGTLPGGIELRDGLGVMEHHRASW